GGGSGMGFGGGAGTSGRHLGGDPGCRARGAENEGAQQRAAAVSVATLNELAHQPPLGAAAGSGPRRIFISFGAVIPSHTRLRRMFTTFTVMPPARTIDAPPFCESTSIPTLARERLGDSVPAPVMQKPC